MAWLEGHTRDKEGSWAAIAMATIPTKTTIDQSALDKTGIDKTATDGDARMAGTRLPAWPPGPNSSGPSQDDSRKDVLRKARELRPSGVDALQALLAFSALHQQVRNRRALASRLHGFETIAATAEFDAPEQFVLDEVLQMVAERAIAITGADGLGIALAEQKKFAEALSALKHAREFGAEGVDLLILMGRCAAALDRGPSAVAYYEQALKLEPRNFVARRALSALGRKPATPGTESGAVRTGRD